MNLCGKLKPSFHVSEIIPDMSETYYSRNPNHWYTFIPFTYKGEKWGYRETADGSEWVEKVKEVSKEKGNLDKKIKSVKEKGNTPNFMTEQKVLER